MDQNFTLYFYLSFSLGLSFFSGFFSLAAFTGVSEGCGSSCFDSYTSGAS